MEDNVLYTLARVIEHMGVAGTGAKFVRLGKSVRYRAKGIAVGDGDEDWQEDSRYGLDS